MAHVSLSHYVSHVCTRAWQRHGIELGDFGYRVLLRQVRSFRDETLVTWESPAVTHHRVRYGGVPMLVVYDARQDRLLTVLPRQANPGRAATPRRDPVARARESRALVGRIHRQLRTVRAQLAAAASRRALGVSA